MNKIDEIILLNFQIYKKLVIKLDKGFNCITGGNNEGKTTITRAVDWMFTNSPAGDWMRRIDSKGEMKTASVKFVFDDGKVLKRVKGKDKNYYAIDDNEYHEIGRKIPQEVLELLALNRELFEEIKVMPQIDAQDEHPFLVLSKDTDKARAINLLTGMTDAENTIKLFNARKMGYSREIGFSNKKIDELKDILEDYKFIKDIPLNSIIKKADKLSADTNKLNELKDLLTTLQECKKTIKEYEVLRKAYDKIKKSEALAERIKANKEQLIRLKILHTDFFKAINNQKLVREVDFSALWLQVQDINKKRSTLLKLTKMRDLYDDADIVKSKYATIMDECLQKLKGKTCPTCDGKGVF